MVTIVDYGVGNLASIQNMLKKIGAESTVTSLGQDIEKATKLILPGVGSFDTCSGKLRDSGLLSVLEELVLKQKVPVLGICVGMQLMFRSSEEGKLPGLSWINGKIVRFNSSLLQSDLKIPHMGWTDVVPAKTSRLFDGMYPEPRFYFVHSFHPEPEEMQDAILHAHYGYDFVAGVERGNIAGVQFHPEKSHKFGMKLLENFVNNY